MVRWDKGAGERDVCVPLSTSNWLSLNKMERSLRLTAV